MIPFFHNKYLDLYKLTKLQEIFLHQIVLIFTFIFLFFFKLIAVEYETVEKGKHFNLEIRASICSSFCLCSVSTAQNPGAVNPITIQSSANIQLWAIPSDRPHTKWWPFFNSLFLSPLGNVYKSSLLSLGLPLNFFLSTHCNFLLLYP